MSYPPFHVSFVEVQRRGLRYAREIIRAAVNAVDARDAEIARLRRHVAALEAAAGAQTFTVDNTAGALMGLWTMHADSPQRLCTLATGDRLLVLRASAPVVLDAPAAREAVRAHG